MSIADVICVYNKFNSGNKEAFFEAEKMKNQIILNQSNFWMLLPNINNQEAEPQFQVFIVNLLNDILKHNYTSLPLYEISDVLSQMIYEIISTQTNTSKNVINLIFDLIGLLKFLIYVIDGRFCFNIDIANQSNQHFELFSFFKYFISPPSFIHQLFQKKESTTLFINNQMKPLLTFLFHQIENKSSEWIINVTQCSTILLKQAQLKVEISPEIRDTFFIIFQNKNLNENLNSTLLNFEKFTSSSIIDLLSNALNYQILLEQNFNGELFESIFNSIILIIENAPKFLNEEEIISSFCNFISSIPIEKAIFIGCEKFTSIFLNFIHQILNENYFLAVRILSSSTDFLYNVYDYIPFNSAIFSSYASLFESFIRGANKAIEKDPVFLFNSLFNGKDEIKMTKKILISLLQASEKIMGKNLSLLIEYLNLIFKDEKRFSLLFDIKESFAIYVSSIIVKYDFDEDVKNGNLNLTNLLFTEFVDSHKRLEDYKNNEELADLYPSEKMIVNFLEMFIKKYVYNSNSKSLHPLTPLSSFSGSSSMIVFIFSRLWEDVVNEVHPEEAEEAISLLLESNKVIEILTTTDYFQNFYDNYIFFPPKSIVYKTIAKVSFANNSYIPFLQKVFSDLNSKSEAISIKIIYKCLSAFFLNAQSNQMWKEVYFGYQANFFPKSEAISKNDQKIIQKVLLKFLKKFVKSAPKDEFKSVEPHSYQIFNSVIQLLTNLTNKTVERFSSEKIEFDDDQMNIIELILLNFSMILKSNFTNYGIMKLYNDQSVFQLFSQIIMIFSNIPHSAIFSLQQLNFNLADLLNTFVLYFKEDMKESDQFWTFFILMSKIILMSNFSDSINLICQTLSSLLAGNSKSLRNHFVLALDALRKKDDLFCAVAFLIQFYLTDENFVFQVGQAIEDFLDDINVKFDFNHIYYDIWNYVVISGSKISGNELILKIYKKIREIKIKLYTLPCLERCFAV